MQREQSNLKDIEISRTKHTTTVVWLPRKPMERKGKENLEKKNVYEKPIKSKQDKDITKITYNSSYSMNIKFQKVIGKKRIMKGNNGYMNKQNGSASVPEQRVIYLCRRSV